ncbi:MAG: response regulator [Lutibacter sp.]|nr:MAG: response regulator [Lutibacter sp.]
MQKEIDILMIDDHPMILEGYKKVLSANKNFKLHISIANDCDQAMREINKSKISNGFDIVFIDIQLPPSNDGTITSGEDLAMIVKEKLPLAKIVILTMIDYSERLQNLIKTIPHDGLLIKSDITSKILLKAFDNVLKNEKFYSKTADKLSNSIAHISEKLDEINKKIIYHLSNGIQTKHLVEYIPLSLSAIEKRKKYIRQFFDVADDEQLLNEAKKRGFI